MTDDEHAQALIAQASDAARRRRACLTAATALSSTATIGAAQKLLAEYEGPADVVTDALAVLGSLGRPVTVSTGGQST